MKLNGLIVIEVRDMTVEEIEAEGQEARREQSRVIVFNDGSKVYASRDIEGNGPGALFGVDKDGEAVHI